jgi:hypothetical protein
VSVRPIFVIYLIGFTFLIKIFALARLASLGTRTAVGLAPLSWPLAGLSYGGSLLSLSKHNTILTHMMHGTDALMDFGTSSY